MPNLINQNKEVVENSILLIVANKQDLENAMKVEEIKDKLELNKLKGVKSVNIIGTCAKTGAGLYECLDWITSTLALKSLNEPLLETANDATHFINTSIISNLFGSAKLKKTHENSIV